ncbi:oxidoreductase [Serinicoccus chungangensis]|uniref:Oxidoreductase n=1 Tax=Serinicoccus chungangensis TaxID=767452 RepID=A0A0W8I144_9MICO|nr:FMN reductase [Serinicoccus chungangensis]KUG51139.1 oxidoreductase [Serinicoccus chungangensis]
MTRRIVVLTAGLSQPSSTRLLADRLADAVVTQVSARGEAATVEVVELRELAHDLATTMTTGGVPTPAVEAARELVSGADAIVAVSPVFAASYSGLFKMFVDVLDPDAVAGTPVLVAATAGTARHQLVLDHALRPLFAYLRAAVVPTGVFAATDDFGGAGSGELGERISRAAGELATAVVAAGVGGLGSDPASGRSGARVGQDVTDFEDLLAGLGQ